MTRRSWLVRAIAAPAFATREAASRAAAYLWRAQGAGGGWHSSTYGLLRSGQSLTPLVLHALLESGEQPPAGGVERAVEFIRRGIDADGALGRADGMVADYPCYATSLGVMALARYPGCEALVKRMAAYLRTQQLADGNGWSRDDPAYGAWGMGVERKRPPHAGHVDLSMTRHAMQALRASGAGPDDPALQRGRVFVDRCQNLAGDGGFFFSTVIAEANKAGHDGRNWRSYGTASADGLLALAAAGATREDARFRRAAQWLARRWSHGSVPGFETHADRRWARGLRCYWRAAMAEARALLGERGAIEAGGQRADGSWANPEGLVKEDDPLIATALTLKALTLSAGKKY